MAGPDITSKNELVSAAKNQSAPRKTLLSEFRGKVRLVPLDVSDDSIQRVIHYLIHAPDSELGRTELCTLELLRRFPYAEG